MIEPDVFRPEPPKRKRRWFQFSLRTLMIGVTLLAVACGYVGWQARIVRERKAIRREVAEMRGVLHFASDVSISGSVLTLVQPRLNPPYPTVSSLRAWLGDDAALSIQLPESTAPSTFARVQAAFPEVVVGSYPEPKPEWNGALLRASPSR